MYSVESDNKYIYVNCTALNGGAFTMQLKKRGTEVIDYTINLSLTYTTSRGSKFSFTDDIDFATYDATIFQDGVQLANFFIYYTSNEHIPRSVYQ